MGWATVWAFFSQTLLATLLSNQTMQRGLGDMAQ
jgi:hypothetical protein